MNHQAKLATPLALTAFLILIWGNDAHAYMDLGTGSYVLQLFLAGFLGALFAIKMYWRSLKNTLRNLLSRNRHARKSDKP